MKTLQDPILIEWEAASISSQNGSKKWKKSTFIFNGLIVLFVLIPNGNCFSILNMVKNSTLEAKLELEVENVKSLESQLELEIASRTVQDNVGENDTESTNEVNEKIEAAKGRII